MVLRYALLASLILLGGRATEAGTDDILIGLDEKITYGPDGQINGPPGKDAILVMDASNPAKPKIRASLPLMRCSRDYAGWQAGFRVYELGEQSGGAINRGVQCHL